MQDVPTHWNLKHPRCMYKDSTGKRCWGRASCGVKERETCGEHKREGAVYLEKKGKRSASSSDSETKPALVPRGPRHREVFAKEYRQVIASRAIPLQHVESLSSYLRDIFKKSNLDVPPLENDLHAAGFFEKCKHGFQVLKTTIAITTVSCGLLRGCTLIQLKVC